MYRTVSSKGRFRDQISPVRAAFVSLSRIAGSPQASPSCAATGTSRQGIHGGRRTVPAVDRKSTRLNSSHVATSYAVFCLKKKTAALAESSPPWHLGQESIRYD